LTAAGTSVGIAIALYPVLKKTHPALATGAVVFRTIEAVFYTAAVVSLLSITTLGKQLLSAPTVQLAPIQVVADHALSVRDHSTLAGVTAFSVATVLYCVVFYRARLVPRWLAAWGLVGALLMGCGCLASLFGDQPVTGYYQFFLPIAAWEMVIAVWLIVKGFSSAGSGNDVAIASGRPWRSEVSASV
jgi:hypothetical protein